MSTIACYLNMDALEIKGLQTKTHIGVHAWEQRIKQTLLFDIHIPFDISQCNDRLSHTIDYALLCQTIITFVESHAFTLIETVAEEVATLLKQTFPRIQTLRLSISKPHAIPSAENISITITR